MSTEFHMSTESSSSRGRRLERGALLALLLLPFLPELLIIATSIYAGAVGCQIDAKMACAVGPPSASEIIRISLHTAYFIGSKFAEDGIVAGWLALCFVLIIFGWSRLSRRLLLAFAASLIFGFLPYFGPMLAIWHLENPYCHPNEGSVGPCKIYGGDVDSAAHDAVRLGWKIFEGAPFAFAAFLVFVVVATIMHLHTRRRIAPSPQ
jgi:hypothetical protein